MATKTLSPISARDPVGVGERIIVERRQVIAVIEPSPQGTESMIAASYLACGRYFAENDDMPGFELTFVAYGRTFRAVMDPDPSYSPINGRSGHDDLDED